MDNYNRTAKSLNNIVNGLFFRFVSTVFPFVIRTVIVVTLGTKYLGLNSLFNSILAVLSLSELGIGGALVFNMYKPIAENDVKQVNALLNTYKKYYRIIGFIILGLGICVMPFLRYLIKGSYPQELNLYLLYIVYLSNAVISYWVFAYKVAILEASQQNSIDSRIHSFVKTGMYIAQIVGLYLTHDYYVYLICLPISTLTLNLVRSVIVDRRFPQYCADGEIETSLIKSVFNKVKALFGHKIGTIVITSADSIVISSFLGLEIVGIYGNYYTVIHSLISLITIFYTSITASVGNSLISTDKKTTLSHFRILVFINSWIVGWCTVCLVCLYQPFMTLWMGEEMLFPFHMVLLLAFYFYSWLIRRIGLTYKDAAGRWEEDFWKPYIGAVVNLVTNIIMVKIIGIEGVVISTIIVMVFIYFPWETIVVGKYIFEHSMKEYVTDIGKNLAITIIACVVTFWVTDRVAAKGILGLIIRGVICCFVPNAIFALCYFRTQQFCETLNRIKKLLYVRP